MFLCRIRDDLEGSFARTGVYTIIAHDDDTRRPQSASMTPLEQFSGFRAGEMKFGILRFNVLEVALKACLNLSKDLPMTSKQGSKKTVAIKVTFFR